MYWDKTSRQVVLYPADVSAPEWSPPYQVRKNTWLAPDFFSWLAKKAQTKPESEEPEAITAPEPPNALPETECDGQLNVTHEHEWHRCLHRRSHTSLLLAILIVFVLLECTKQTEENLKGPTETPDEPTPTNPKVNHTWPAPNPTLFFMADGGAVNVATLPEDNNLPLWLHVGSLPLSVKDGGIAVFTISANVLANTTAVQLLPERTNGNSLSYVPLGVQLVFRVLDSDDRPVCSRNVEYSTYVPYSSSNGSLNSDVYGIQFPISFELFCELAAATPKHPYRLQVALLTAEPHTEITLTDVQWSALVWDREAS